MFSYLIFQGNYFFDYKLGDLYYMILKVCFFCVGLYDFRLSGENFIELNFLTFVFIIV